MYMSLKNWYVKENSIDISLMYSFVRITFIPNDGIITYQLDIYQDAKKELTINFSSLEEAIEFTEEVVNKYRTIDQIMAARRKKEKRKVRSIKD